MIRLALALLLLTAGTPWKGVDTLGVRLTLCGDPANGPAMARWEDSNLPFEMWPRCYQRVKSSSDLQWVQFAVRGAPRWPRGFLPVLYAEGRREPVAWFAVGGPPYLNPVPLEALADSGRMARERLRCTGEVSSMVFVGYKPHWSPDSVTAVRLEPPSR